MRGRRAVDGDPLVTGFTEDYRNLGQHAVGDVFIE